MSQDEELDIRKKHEAAKKTYETFSDHIMQLCNTHKNEHPTQVRLVFSRYPKVKEVESLINKIRKKRIENPDYGYDNLEDLVALTVLCPYISDVKDFIAWLDKAFHLITR
jgi:ppGpp synthetase/RelA/SpoT-type nucleotidyltranferase